MIRILGIDPGSNHTGFGVIETDFQRHRLQESGVISTGGGDFPKRLQTIYDGLREVIMRNNPDQVAVEEVFMSRNADSALKLGQARGAAICAAVSCHAPVFEYAARSVKQAIAGKGSAEKHQVAHMVRILLNVSSDLKSDEADALAVALCHAHTQASREAMGKYGSKWR